MRSWLAILIYNCARGQNHFKVYSQRLRSLYEPVYKPEILWETIGNNIPKTPDGKGAANVKKRIMSRLTPNKMERRMLNFPKMLGKVNVAGVKPSSFTLGKLVVIWAILTDQSAKDFIIKIYPRVNRMYKDWRNITGCRGLSDEECYSHPKESARFWSGICRTLIRETPEENLINVIQGGIESLGTVIEIPGPDKKIYELLGQVSRIITEDAAKRIESAFKANSLARNRINIPELQVLVLREEEKLGWGKNTEEQAVRILRENLSQELKEVAGNKDEVIKGSMEAVGRRGLLNNLETALKGQLRPRFIGSIWHLLQNMSKCVSSTWDFESSALIKEQRISIRQWLYRR